MKLKKIDPEPILVIAGLLLGYIVGPFIGIDRSLGALLGGVFGFVVSRYL